MGAWPDPCSQLCSWPPISPASLTFRSLDLSSAVLFRSCPQELESRSWVMVTAKVTAEKHKLYKGDVGPVLTAIRVVKGAEPAEPDVCTF